MADDHPTPIQRVSHLCEGATERLEAFWRGYFAALNDDDGDETRYQRYNDSDHATEDEDVLL